MWVSKNNIFVLFSFSFLFWVFLNNYFVHPKLSFLVFLFIGIFLCNYFLWHKKFLSIIISLLIGLSLWVWWSYSHLSYTGQQLTKLESFFESKQYNIQSRVDSLYQVKPYSKQYLVNIIRINEVFFNEKILAIVEIPSNFIIKNGAIISWKSKLPIKT